MLLTVYSSHGFDQPYLTEALTGTCEVRFTSAKLDLDTTELAAGSEAVALFTSDTANAPVLEKLYTMGIRFIALRSAGFDHIDLDKARELGIKVANAPAYSPYAVAEHAVALLLALNRKILLGQKLMDLGDYKLDLLTGFDIHGKTIGVIGTGKIGSAFAHIMNGFGCRLLAYDPVPDIKLTTKTGISYVELAEIYKHSDIISVHCPLNSQTKHLLSGTAFMQMKKGVGIINTSRGGIVDTLALFQALESGTVGFAGLDVYEHEKPFFFEDLRGNRNSDEIFLKLRSYPNVLVTGHQAFLTQEALAGIAQATKENLDAWEHNISPANELH